MIFYLSCTGNTQWAARRLAEVSNEKLISVPEAVQGDCVFHLSKGERIGFCLPVHGWRVQPIVREFIERMTFSTGQTAENTVKAALCNHYCYFLVTCGDSCGEYADQLEALLTTKGIKVNTCCSLVMPESYVGLPGMDVDPDLREAEKKMKANGMLQKFSEIVIDRRSVRMPIERGAMPRLYSRVLGTFFYKYLVTDKRFKVDTSRCIGCGKCVKHCPVDNIRMEASAGVQHPEWLHNDRCLTCMACYHYCPEKAISFWCFTKNKGQYFFDHNRQIRKKI